MTVSTVNAVFKFDQIDFIIRNINTFCKRAQAVVKRFQFKNIIVAFCPAEMNIDGTFGAVEGFRAIFAAEFRGFIAAVSDQSAAGSDAFDF